MGPSKGQLVSYSALPFGIFRLEPNPRNGYKKGGKFYLNRESFPLVTLEWNQPDLHLCYFFLLYFVPTNVVSCFSCALTFFLSLRPFRNEVRSDRIPDRSLSQST